MGQILMKTLVKKKVKTSRKQKILQKVVADMTLYEIISKNPRVASKLSALGLGCAGCSCAYFETLRQASKHHNLDLKKLLVELNK